MERRLVELEAKGFRNLGPLHLRLGAGAHLVLGANGAGKTSLLEAIYLATTTRSFRTSQVSDCRRHGEASFWLAAEVEGVARSRLEVVWDGGRLQRRVNGQRTPLAQHLDVLPTVCWTTRDVEFLIGPPEERRRFIDRGVVASRPTLLADYTRYRRALEAKRRLLTEGKGADEIAVWNQLLADSAAVLIQHRARYVERLRSALADTLEACRLEFPGIEIEYRPSPRNGVEGRDALLETLAESLERERKLERPLHGPHRDELVIRWDDHPIRRVASAGERKALGLVCFAAQGRLLAEDGRAPLYLLDDADSELDRERLGALWRVFGQAHQVLATSNRREIWEGLEIAHRWRCEAGELAAEG